MKPYYKSVGMGMKRQVYRGRSNRNSKLVRMIKEAEK